jgi:hypothetical protein
MSIFVTDEDPRECAEALADQHVRSQLSKTARALTTALYRRSITGPLLGRPDKKGSRFAVWAAEDWNHFQWLAFHGLALIEEHEYRFDESHKDAAGVFAAGQIGYLMMDETFTTPTEWPLPSRGAKSSCVFDAYQNVLRDKYEKWGEAGRFASWTNAYPPEWLASTGQVVHLDTEGPCS